jgi:hypothetical protein
MDLSNRPERTARGAWSRTWTWIETGTCGPKTRREMALPSASGGSDHRQVYKEVGMEGGREEGSEIRKEERWQLHVAH